MRGGHRPNGSSWFAKEACESLHHAKLGGGWEEDLVPE